MEDSSITTHIPFAKLSPTERFLYWIGAMTAMAMLRPWPPTPEELPEIIRIWDEQRFTPADAVDFCGMADRLKPHLEKYAVKDLRAWNVDLA